MDFIKDIHYYMDGDRVVFTALFHIQRGQCCGNGCKNCAYDPKYKKGNVVLAEKFRKLIDKEDKNGSE
jgi:2-iminoacetate synthase ThiH